MIKFRRCVSGSAWILGILLFFGAQPGWSQGKDHVDISNFAHVTATLYRGAQPSHAGFSALQHMGVGIVVNFRNDGEAVNEKKEVESLGMKYVSIPWSGSQDPSNAQIVQFLDLVQTNPNVKIFVHCRRGADRTGTMVAAYRIAVQHESIGDAVSEMHEYHYAKFWLPQLERYVRSLPVLLQRNPQFSAYAPAQPARAAVTAAASIAAPVALPAIP